MMYHGETCFTDPRVVVMLQTKDRMESLCNRPDTAN